MPEHTILPPIIMCSADTIPENFQPFSKPPSGFVGTGGNGSLSFNLQDISLTPNRVIDIAPSGYRSVFVAPRHEVSGSNLLGRRRGLRGQDLLEIFCVITHKHQVVNTHVG